MTTNRQPPLTAQDTRHASRKSGDGPAEETREARLKAALKANMARRKAQARARSAGDDAPQDTNNKE